jgi:hypothetical protein
VPLSAFDVVEVSHNNEDPGHLLGVNVVLE